MMECLTAPPGFSNHIQKSTPFGKMDSDGNLWPVLPSAPSTHISTHTSSSTDPGTSTGETTLYLNNNKSDEHCSKSSRDKGNRRNVNGHEKKRRSLSIPSDSGVETVSSQSRSGETISSQSRSSCSSSISGMPEKLYDNFRSKRRDYRRNSSSTSRRSRNRSDWPAPVNKRDVSDVWAPWQEPSNKPVHHCHSDMFGCLKPCRDLPFPGAPPDHNRWYPPPPRPGYPAMYQPRERRNGVAEYDPRDEMEYNPQSRHRLPHARSQLSHNRPQLPNAHPHWRNHHDRHQRPDVGVRDNCDVYTTINDALVNRNQSNRSRYDRFQGTTSLSTHDRSQSRGSRGRNSKNTSSNLGISSNPWTKPSPNKRSQTHLEKLTKEMNNLCVMNKLIAPPRTLSQSKNSRVSKNLSNVFNERTNQTHSRQPIVSSSQRTDTSDCQEVPSYIPQTTGQSAWSHGTYTHAGENVTENASQGGQYSNSINPPNIPCMSSDIDQALNTGDSYCVKSRCSNPSECSNKMTKMSSESIPEKPHKERPAVPVKAASSGEHNRQTLMNEVNSEMAMAKYINLPFKRSPMKKLNPDATVFRPNMLSHRGPGLSLVPQHDQNNNYVTVQMGDSLVCGGTHEQELYRLHALSTGQASPQVQGIVTTEVAQNFVSPAVQHGGYLPVTVYSPLTQTNGNMTSSVMPPATPTTMYLPTSTGAQLGDPQTNHAPNYVQTAIVSDFQAVPVYSSSICHNAFPAPEVSQYTHPATPQLYPSTSQLFPTSQGFPLTSQGFDSTSQGFPQTVVTATTYPEVGQFAVAGSYQTPEQTCVAQELAPGAIMVGHTMAPMAPMTPLTPVLATPMTPLGLYDGQFAYQVAATVPPATMTNTIDAPLRPVQTEARSFTSSHPQTFMPQPAPVFNFQTYCMTVEKDVFQFPDPNMPQIESLGISSETNAGEKTSLIDRVDDTIREVQDCLKNKPRTRVAAKGLSGWEEILEKLLILPPNFREPSDMAEYRQLRRLSHVITSYIQEAKQDGLSEAELFQDILDMSYPVATQAGGETGHAVDSFPEPMGDNSLADRSTRMNRSRANVQRAWQDLVMTISNNASQTHGDHFSEIETASDGSERASCTSADDLPQCDQRYQNNEAADFMHHCLPQCPLPAVVDEGHLQNRRASLGGVNVGTRISYFESNANQDAKKRSSNSKK